MNCDLISGWSWSTEDGQSHLKVLCQRFDEGNCARNDLGCLTREQGVECRYHD
jgi:hypothetical protein